MGSYIKVLGKYATFSGRAPRMEFWGFTIVNSIFWGFIIWLWLQFTQGIGNTVITTIAVMYFAVTVIPGTALIFRRWHDRGRTGAWFFINLVPMIGYIVTLGFFLYKGDEFTNRYGRDPYDTGIRRKRRRPAAKK